MNQSSLPPLFDFSQHKPRRDEILGLIKQFASHEAFRSAVVDELELDEDFYRRPLRPEDLAFLKFQKPISAETVSRLPSLATNRLLLSINELGIARLPRRQNALEFERFESFYRDSNQLLGQQIRPYLESYGFTYLGNEPVAGKVIRDYSRLVREVFDAEQRHWAGLFAMLTRNDYLNEGLRLILIQQWALAPSRRSALARAAASGYFAGIASTDWPTLAGALPSDALMREVAAMSGVARQSHSYWQFYLPTSLAKVNLLYALGSRPDRAFALLGAAFAAEAEWLAFGAALLAACPHLKQLEAVPPANEESLYADLDRRLRHALAVVEDIHGGNALSRVGQGAGAYAKLADRARWDLGEQLRWLSAIPRYCAWARVIDQRIQVEYPNIDRDTFVEPREMCSTTHVHSDHRLVVIERGDMVFWGNLGMQLKMTVGDMVLIPDGRLHGSTVVSEECTYHQPIIPDAWIEELLAETAIRHPVQAH
ncbi:peptide synthetase [Pollutimonas bauzanensis]|uniref:Peptide synthetase n=1 Tax=Pollutimonas bauzanensis TaxID=658167 RepID=A0A1M5W2A9_9BURK|nr:peptide synthetase [Pollutimonas bauzanensis]SHH81343.1 hypothetical protein SAMN04488135_10545 [Pollutimonas bauzanensis]